MNMLYIIRGLPGSGKSTFAKNLIGTHLAAGDLAFHFEADMYFLDADGNYVFDATKLKDAHSMCFDAVKSAMMMNANAIAVSNTFTREWEFNNYVKLAKENAYMVTTLVVENRHGGVNEHNVPEDVLKDMKSRFELKL